MVNIKSAAKRARKAAELARRNSSLRSKCRTMVRRFNDLLRQDPSEAEKFFPNVSSALDKAVKKGAIHRNTAARKKSRLARLLHARLEEASGAEREPAQG
ncbi:MAG TPA: 30S ribosomal protein S20 [Clostridiales bacterium]|nr:30S ribosomal protein S20 [Clostridiales bacterium]